MRGLEPIFGRWPWPRIVHASVIDYIARAGARVIVYDVVFSERETRNNFEVAGQTIRAEDSDLALVGAVRNAGNVVLAVDASFQGLAESRPDPQKADPFQLPGVTYAAGAGFERRPSVQKPFRELAAVARGLGHTYLVKEGESVRRIRPFIEHDGVTVPSLGVAAALAALNATPEDVGLEVGRGLTPGASLRIGANARAPLLDRPVPSTPPVPSRQMLLRFPARTAMAKDVESLYPTYAFFDVLLSEDQRSAGKAPVVSESAFKDKLVFIGTSAAGLGDRYQAPTSPDGVPGVVLHAVTADNILTDAFMRRASRATTIGSTIAIGLASAGLAVMLPVIGAVAAVLVLLVAFGWWVTQTAGTGVWMTMTTPMLAGAFALFGGVAWQYFVEGAAKRQMRQLFGRYVSNDVIEQLIDNPDAARLGGQRREMTVLFSDIRGFTNASEKRGPEAVVAQLNEYFGAMVGVLFRHHGTLDKFVGDMVMGLFGAPLQDARHADHAVRCALEMLTELDRLNARWKVAGLPPVDIGIGINTGEMIAGNIGSEAIMSYTVIGDAVNLGSRLESLNKEHGTHILISEATRAQLTIPVATRPIGEVHVKGRAEGVLVHEVLRDGKREI